MEKLLESNCERLVLYCKERAIQTNAAATAEAIAESERQLGISFPADYKKYLFMMNGFADDEWDEDCISFWSLDRIGKSHVSHPQQLVIIADYSLECCAWGFYRADEKVYITYDSPGYVPKPAAASFAQFLEMYLTDKAGLFIE